MKLKDRIAIITGAASGLGEACARRFAEEGALVVIADISEENGLRTSESIQRSNFIQVDVTSPESVEAMVADTLEKFGRVDILMNNAGIDGEQAAITDCSIENWRQVMDINLNGVFYGLKYGLIPMVKQKSGVILNMSSLAGLTGLSNISPYGASKAGVVQLTRVAAVENAAFGIRVNALCPGVARTALLEHFIETSGAAEDLREFFETMNPLPGLISLECIAASALFLVSDDAAFITGLALPVDGGFSAGRKLL